MFYLRKHDDPALKTVCMNLREDESRSFIGDMRRIRKEADGVGLAAPQIGVLKNVILVGNRCLINPVVTWESPATALGQEGCLSYPGVFVDVRRCQCVEVAYLDDQLKEHRDKFHNFEARILQHELDHLLSRCVVGDEWRRLGKPMNRDQAQAAFYRLRREVSA